MGNFGQVPNYFRGILLHRNLFVTAVYVLANETAVLYCGQRDSEGSSNGNMPFKVLGMTSLLSLPLGIVLHPFCGCVGLHAIRWHWQHLHWQRGRRNWQWHRQRLTRGRNRNIKCNKKHKQTENATNKQWQPPRLTFDSHTDFVLRTNFTKKIRKMEEEQERNLQTIHVTLSWRTALFCHCHQMCWNGTFEVVQNFPIHLTA